MDFDPLVGRYSDVVAFLFCERVGLFFFSHQTNSKTGLAELIIRYALGEVEFAGAGVALADGVGIVVGEGLPLLAGVEAEHPFGVLPERVLRPPVGLVPVGRAVRVLQHLDRDTSTVPSIRRVVLVPEGVGHRQGDPVQGGVFRPHLVVPGRPVLASGGDDDGSVQDRNRCGA